MTVQCRINGEDAAQLSVFNRGLAYGDGLFETIAVRGKKPLLLGPHLQRLQAGLKALRMSCDLTALRSEIDSLLGQAQTPYSCLKVILVRGSDGGRGYKPADNASADRILQLGPWHPNGEPARLKNCELTLSHRPLFKGLKTLNSLEYVIAAAELGEFDEGILCDHQGYIVEGTKSNLFWVNSSGVLVTPALDKAGVEGVVRNEIIRRAPAEGIPVKVTRPTIDALQTAREVFITNSLIGVQSVGEYEGRQLSDFDMAATVRDLLHGDILDPAHI